MTTVQTGPQTIETRIGPLEFTHDFANGYPTDATVEKLYDERDFQRACQAYLWSLPAVAFTSFQRGLTKELGAGNGQIVAVLSYESRRGILTANATTPYYPGVRRRLLRAVGAGDALERRAGRAERRVAARDRQPSTSSSACD